MRPHHKKFRLLIGRCFASLTAATLISCSSQSGGGGTRNDSDDAFISPSGEAAAPLPEENAGAGDLGAPAQELQMVFFPFDSSVLSPEAVKALKENSNFLRDNPSVKVQVEGHCDERGTVEYNLALGERRAKAAAARLKKLGIPAARVSTISYGKERPLDPGHDETAWGKNRRASFVIVSQ